MIKKSKKYDKGAKDKASERQYAALAESVAQLDKVNRVRPAVRNEIGSQISEFHVEEKRSKAKVNTNELVNVLSGQAKFSEIDKTLKKVSKKVVTLPKPLQKPFAEKIKRKSGFAAVKKQLQRWDAVVTANRGAEHIIFPLNEPKFSFFNGSNCREPFQTQLEKDLYEAEFGELPEPKIEEKDEFPLTLEEMVERRKEVARLRARQSYRETKAYHQSKIKSKKYHRIKKREKMKKQIKEFETLQKINPEEALKKLDEIERVRAEERANLRHRNTGKWAKNHAVRAKYDKEARRVLSEQLAVSRDLTAKARQDDSSDEDLWEPNPGILKAAMDIAKSNPWSLEVSAEVNEFLTDFQNYWEAKKKSEIPKEQEKNEKVDGEVKIVVPNAPTVSVENGKVSTSKKPKATSKWQVSDVTNDKVPNAKSIKDLDIDDAFYLADKVLVEKATEKFKLLKGKIKPMIKSSKREKKIKLLEGKIKPMTKSSKRKRKILNDPDLTLKKPRWQVERAIIDEELGIEKENGDSLFSEAVPSSFTVTETRESPKKLDIDPDKFLKVKTKMLNTALPDDLSDGEEGIDDEEREAQNKVIMEAFADDNVVAEFQNMKKDAEKSTEMDVEDELPGWGAWGGVGVRLNGHRKRKRFLQVPQLPSRKDSNLPDIIINEDANPKVKEHMVKEVPFPFRSVEAFESNIRAPISREWVPEKAHRSLIRPQVVTRLGTIIEPISDEVILRNQRPERSLFKGKKKEMG